MTNWLHLISPCIRHVGTLRHSLGWVEPQRFIHDHQLVLFEKGDFDVELPTQILRCPAGTFVIIPPGVYHVTRMLSRSGRRRWVHFDWVYPRKTRQRPLISYPPQTPKAADLCPAPPFVPPGILHGVLSQPASLELHRHLDSLWNTHQPREQLLCRGVLLQLLVELLGPPTSETPPSASRSSLLAQAIRLRMDQLSQTPIDDMPSIQKEIESLGCSYAHACRVFQGAYHLSPLAYTHRLRIERAKLLLRKGKLSVAQVGEAVGIANAAYFSRLFRNLVGLCPRQYIARQQ